MIFFPPECHENVKVVILLRDISGANIYPFYTKSAKSLSFGCLRSTLELSGPLRCSKCRSLECGEQTRTDEDSPDQPQCVKPIDVIMTSRSRASSTYHSLGLSDSGNIFIVTGNFWKFSRTRGYSIECSFLYTIGNNGEWEIFLLGKNN